MFHAWPPQNRQNRKTPTEYTIDSRGVLSGKDFRFTRRKQRTFTQQLDHRFEWVRRAIWMKYETHKSLGNLVYPLSTKWGAWSYKYLPPSYVCVYLCRLSVCLPPSFSADSELISNLSKHICALLFVHIFCWLHIPRRSFGGRAFFPHSLSSLFLVLWH